jgi:hypothetical protein
MNIFILRKYNYKNIILFREDFPCRSTWKPASIRGIFPDSAIVSEIFVLYNKNVM